MSALAESARFGVAWHLAERHGVWTDPESLELRACSGPGNVWLVEVPSVQDQPPWTLLVHLDPQTAETEPASGLGWPLTLVGLLMVVLGLLAVGLAAG